jgi:bacterioferritin-associated ferredoxin
MIVCICKAVSDKAIRRAANEGVVTLRELSRELGVGTCCGKCVPQAREILTAAIPDEAVRMPGLMGMPATA